MRFKEPQETEMEILYRKYSAQKTSGRRATGDDGGNKMLKFEDPRQKRKKTHAVTPRGEDRFGEKAEFSASRIQPDSYTEESEMIKSVRSGPRG